MTRGLSAPEWVSILLAVVVWWLVFTVPEGVPTIPGGASAIPAGVPIYACEFEDGAGQDVCYWDAGTMGNGGGRSFVKVGDRYVYE